MAAFTGIRTTVRQEQPARSALRRRSRPGAASVGAGWRGLLAAAALLTTVGCGAAARVTTLSDDVPLDDGTWVLAQGVVDGAVLTVPQGTRISLTVVGADASGTAACNDYGARVRQHGARVTFGEMGLTAIGCAPAVMAAEDRYLAGLERVTTAERDDDVLTLTGPDTSLVFTRLPAVDQDAIVGRTWTLTALIDGTESRDARGQPATLRLRADGTLSGSTGCRQLSGTHTVTGDEIFFPDLAADGTCPSGLQDQDDHVVDVLGDGFTTELEGRRLTVTNNRGRGLRYVARGP